MKQYTDQALKDLLLEADYPNDERLLKGVITRIREFGPEAAALFEAWAEQGKSPKFEVEGITSDNLKRRFKMKDVALIIAYDWLRKKPHEAARLLSKPIII